MKKEFIIGDFPNIPTIGTYGYVLILNTLKKHENNIK